jgi:hypothetical protein
VVYPVRNNARYVRLGDIAVVVDPLNHIANRAHTSRALEVYRHHVCYVSLDTFARAQEWQPCLLHAYRGTIVHPGLAHGINILVPLELTPTHTA